MTQLDIINNFRHDSIFSSKCFQISNLLCDEIEEKVLLLKEYQDIDEIEEKVLLLEEYQDITESINI